MGNRRIKIICICVSILIVVFSFVFGRKWSETKMSDSIQSSAEIAGLKDISIELSEYDKGKIFVRSSNFDKIEWNTLLSMYTEMLSVRGVNEVIFSRYTSTYGYILYEVDVDENMIRCYGGAEDIDYYGSWENGKKHFSVSSSVIKEDLEQRKNDSEKDSSEGRETDAKICAVKSVKDTLKSPSTADFCKYTEMTATNMGGDKWKITGWVDAQNSFGATIRENWTVILTLTGSGFKDASVSFN